MIVVGTYRRSALAAFGHGPHDDDLGPRHVSRSSPSDMEGQRDETGRRRIQAMATSPPHGATPPIESIGCAAPPADQNGHLLMCVFARWGADGTFSRTNLRSPRTGRRGVEKRGNARLPAGNAFRGLMDGDPFAGFPPDSVPLRPESQVNERDDTHVSFVSRGSVRVRR
jgi:hypothetical protein